MRHYLDSISEFVLERSAEELIVGVFLALMLAMIMGGLHSLVRHKVKDTMMLVTVVGLVANVLAMVMTAGYIRMKFDRNRDGRLPVSGAPSPSHRNRPSPMNGHEVPIDYLVTMIFEDADANRDGRLSESEIADASAHFLKAIEAQSGRPIDRSTLAYSIHQRWSVESNHHHGAWIGSSLDASVGRPHAEVGRKPAPGRPTPPGM